MKEKTKTTTVATTPKVKQVKKTPLADTITRTPTTLDDLKSALLVVSLLINTYILIGWIALQVTTRYDLQVATMLFVR